MQATTKDQLLSFQPKKKKDLEHFIIHIIRYKIVTCFSFNFLFSTKKDQLISKCVDLVSNLTHFENVSKSVTFPKCVATVPSSITSQSDSGHQKKRSTRSSVISQPNATGKTRNEFQQILSMAKVFIYNILKKSAAILLFK